MSNDEAPANDDGVFWTHERPLALGEEKLLALQAQGDVHQLPCGRWEFVSPASEAELRQQLQLLAQHAASERAQALQEQQQALGAQRVRDDPDDPVPDVVHRGTRLVRGRSLWLPLLLFMLVQCCVGSVVATDDKLNAIFARLDSLETTVVEQRAVIDEQRVMIQQQNATIQQLHEDIDRQHFDNLATKRDVFDLKVQRSNERHKTQQVVQQQRRALASSTCDEPERARLQVDGVCSCADDVVIGNRSVFDDLTSLESALTAVNATVQGLAVDVATMSESVSAPATARTHNIDNCTLVGVVFSPDSVGSVKATTNLDEAEAIVLSSDDTLAFVAAWGGSRLTIANVTDPANPTVVGSIQNTKLQYPSGVAVSSTDALAFVTSYGQHRLTIVSVVDPTNPVIVGSIQATTNLYRAGAVVLSSDDTLAFVVGGDGSSDSRLTIVNVTDQANPTVVGSIQNSKLAAASNVELDSSDTLAFVTSSAVDRLTIVSVVDPTNPVIVGSFQENTKLNGAADVALSSDNALAFVVAKDAHRLTTFNISRVAWCAQPDYRGPAEVWMPW